MFDQSNMSNFDSTVIGNNNVVDNDMTVDVNMMNYNNGGMMNNAVNEGVQERCIHRTFVHEVPHV